MAKKDNKKGLSYDQKIKIIWGAGIGTVFLLGFSIWFGLVRTGII